MRKLTLIGVVTTALFACESPTSETDPQTIINKAIEVHGGSRYEQAHVSFTFRGKQYSSERAGGTFRYVRSFSDSAGRVEDILSNRGFERLIEGSKLPLPDSLITSYTGSVNSVIYFALLPYALNDPAVIKKYMGKYAINDRQYDKIQVTFRQEGGGQDHEDTYVYWINTDTHTMDYLAYTFQVNGGGARFRQAFNEREIKGIRFADYYNYEPSDLQVPITRFDSLFNAGGMEKVSEIVLENIQVQLLDSMYHASK